MSDFDATQRVLVSYIDKSREYYLARGHANPYRWATHEDTPFASLGQTAQREPGRLGHDREPQLGG